MSVKDHLRLLHRRFYWARAGVIFIHVPKAAGTSVSTALYGRFLGHHTAAKIQNRFPRFFKNNPSFGVVRNPWDRCVSAYRFAKRPIQHNETSPSINLAVRREIAQYETFQDFVFDWLQHQDLATADYVFQDQSRFLLDQDAKMLVKFIGKVEKMHAMQAWLNTTMPEPRQIAHMNKSGAATSYHDWYTPKTQRLVGDIYADDIRHFNYKF